MNYIALYFSLYLRGLHFYISIVTGRGTDELTDEVVIDAKGLWICDLFGVVCCHLIHPFGGRNGRSD